MVRKKRRRTTRIIERECMICGHILSIHVSKERTGGWKYPESLFYIDTGKVLSGKEYWECAVCAAK